MKIALLQNNETMLYRFQHFINTIKEKHTVLPVSNISLLNEENFDLVLIDYFVHSLSDPHGGMCKRINSFKTDLLKFKGKIVFYSLDDGQAIYHNLLDWEIINRVDGWIVYMINTTFLNLEIKHADVLKDKFVLIPRYTIPYVKNDDIVYENKQNKIVFIGNTTGNYWFNGKNWRVECLKRIWDNSFLRENFDGWLVNDHIIDVPYQDEEYNKTFKFVRKDKYLSENHWLEKLRYNTLSLCIAGHTRYTYRHPQSMAFKSTMLANFDLEKDPYVWLFSDKFKDISYIVKDDLSNFVDICEESLINKEKTKTYANAAYDVYKSYFEVTPKNTYKAYVWKIVVDQFEKLGIEL